MTFKRALINTLFLVLALAAIVGSTAATRSVVANGYAAHRLFRLIGFEYQHGLNTSLLYAAFAGALLFLVWIVGRRVSRRGEDVALRVNTIVAILAAAVLPIDFALRRITGFTAQRFLKRAFDRIRTGTAPDDYGGGTAAVVLTYVLAAAGAVIGVLVVVWLQRRLSRVDLKKFYYRRGPWESFLRVAGTAAAIIFVAANVMGTVTASRNTPTGPDVIFICADALRADALGYSGYGRDTSPFIDRIAGDAVVFRNATSQSSWTKTSVATYLTSDYTMLGTVATKADKLPARAVTLAEVLRNAGYFTGAFVANPWLKRVFGFDQGFDVFREESVESARIEVEDVVAFIAAHRDRPFFLYLHFMDVHNPYQAPKPYYEMFADAAGTFRYRNGLMDDLSPADLEYTRARYDGEIRYLDDKVRDLVGYLERTKRLENTIIVFTSDHGDEFYEHGGLGHGTTLYAELMRVPLFVAHHGLLEPARSEINTPVRSIDIFPTLLDILDVPPPEALDGTSLLPVIESGDSVISTPFLASVLSVDTGENLASLVSDGFRYIHNFQQDDGELYDLSVDPGNRQNLADSIPVLYTEMRDSLLRYFAEYVVTNKTSGNKALLDSKTLKKLKALGYL